MREIKVGDYIRTTSGTIAKLKRIEFDKVDKDLKWYFYDKKEPDINIVKEWCTNKPYIVKYSPDILDLIQEGDYVNDELVTKIKEDELSKYVVTVCCNVYRTDNIEDIVTHQQFNQMKYIVGDD